MPDGIICKSVSSGMLSQLKLSIGFDFDRKSPYQHYKNNMCAKMSHTAKYANNNVYLSANIRNLYDIPCMFCTKIHNKRIK